MSIIITHACYLRCVALAFAYLHRVAAPRPYINRSCLFVLKHLGLKAFKRSKKDDMPFRSRIFSDPTPFQVFVFSIWKDREESRSYEEKLFCSNRTSELLIKFHSNRAAHVYWHFPKTTKIVREAIKWSAPKTWINRLLKSFLEQKVGSVAYNHPKLAVFVPLFLPGIVLAFVLGAPCNPYLLPEPEFNSLIWSDAWSVCIAWIFGCKKVVPFLHVWLETWGGWPYMTLENSPFEDVFPIEKGDIPMSC